MDSIRAMMIVCMEVRRENNQNCSVLCCVRQLYTVIRTRMRTVLKFARWFTFRFRFVRVFRFSIFPVFFWY